MTKPQITISHAPHVGDVSRNYIRRYHTTAKISEGIKEFIIPFRSDETSSKIIGETGASIIKEVGLIPGMVSIFIDPYGLYIIRRITSDIPWEEIDSKVVGVLRQAFGDKIEKVEVVYPEEEIPSQIQKKGFLRKLLKW